MNTNTTNTALIDKIKKYFEEEQQNREDITTQFSDEVIKLAYQKMTAGLTDIFQEEEDPMVIGEMLNNYLNVTKMIDERGLARQQFLLKLFEQLNKYNHND